MLSGLVLPAAAAAAPAVPSFLVAPDGYAAYEQQSTCDATAKPGVVDFRNLVLAAYPGTTDNGIGRACNDGGTSEHKEGRAWDWGVYADTQGHIAADLLNWLQATRDGYNHALMRRLGIMYIIWNRQILRSWNIGAGWQPYACNGTASDCHTNHVHFSFGWAGARKQTSWWTGQGSPPAPPPIEADSVRAEGDFNGDGRDDVAVLYEYPNSTALWIFNGTGSGFAAPVVAWSSGAGNWLWDNSKVTAGDFNGDGRADVAVLYKYPDSTALWIFYANGGGMNAPVVAWSSGPDGWLWDNSKPVAGDFDGDGRTDVAVLYKYPTHTALWVFRSNGGGMDAPAPAWSSGVGAWGWENSKVTAGDFNGDGRADVAVLYKYPSTSGLWIFYGGSLNAPTLVWSSGVDGWLWDNSKIAAGDVDGDGRADLSVLYKYPTHAALWVFRGAGSGVAAPAVLWSSGVGGWEWDNSKLVGGDFNGDGRADLAALYKYPSNSALLVFHAAGGGVAAPVVGWSSGAGAWAWDNSKVT